MQYPEFSPLNDFEFFAVLRRRDAAGVEGPETVGPVTAFLAITNTADAVPVVAATCTHVGAGRWFIAFDAAAMTAAALAPFAAATPYVLITQPGAIRVYVECRYRAARAAVVE